VSRNEDEEKRRAKNDWMAGLGGKTDIFTDEQYLFIHTYEDPSILFTT
jgi:hypothetical protein